MSRTASVGYVVKMGRPMATSQDFVNWVCTDVIDPDWLKWLFVAERRALHRFGKGSTHTTVYFPEWLSLHVALPSIEEQREIVVRIDCLMDYADELEDRLLSVKTKCHDTDYEKIWKIAKTKHLTTNQNRSQESGGSTSENCSIS